MAAAASVERETLRVVIAEDSVLLREAVTDLLVTRGCEVVGAVADGEALLQAVVDEAPDVALVDIRMPPGHSDEGLRAADDLARLAPDVGVLVLSQYLDAAWAERLLSGRASARGYVLKDRIASVDGLLDALRTVAEGGCYVDPAVVEALMRRNGDDELGELTARELDILALMAEGRSNSAICARLFLSPKTVETYVRSIFMKLGLPMADDDNRRVLAVLRYLRSL